MASANQGAPMLDLRVGPPRGLARAVGPGREALPAAALLSLELQLNMTLARCTKA